MQAIVDFERKHGIPTDWVNFAIRYSSPNGFWQRLERGEIRMDAEFFKGFTSDLNNQKAWREYHANFRNEKKRLKDTANPTLLGDHVSLKAEAADSRPTNQDLGSRSEKSSGSNTSPESSPSPGTNERPSLSKLAKDTTIGDPVSLEAEDVVESSKTPDSRTDSTPEAKEPIVSPASSNGSKSSLPSPPSIDGEALFWSMMSASRVPDPYVFPALERLLKQRPRPILGALSNTVIFPPDHPWSTNSSTPKDSTSGLSVFDPRSTFDIYVASAEVGMRKPSRDIYELALRQLDAFDRKNGGNGIKSEDVVFLDDIGENLKAGREVGMRTIKVQLGKTWRAVKELEATLGGGVELMDDKTRRSKL